jgi:hypothetical protein
MLDLGAFVDPGAVPERGEKEDRSARQPDGEGGYGQKDRLALYGE